MARPSAVINAECRDADDGGRKGLFYDTFSGCAAGVTGSKKNDDDDGDGDGDGEGGV